MSDTPRTDEVTNANYYGEDADGQMASAYQLLCEQLELELAQAKALLLEARHSAVLMNPSDVLERIDKFLSASDPSGRLHTPGSSTPSR